MRPLLCSSSPKAGEPLAEKADIADRLRFVLVTGTWMLDQITGLTGTLSAT